MLRIFNESKDSFPNKMILESILIWVNFKNKYKKEKNPLELFKQKFDIKRNYDKKHY
jgi:hypothetical protein